MGYFSELDFMQYEETERSDLSKVECLTDRMNSLNERLDELVDQCPGGMLDQEFDRMFYAECLTEIDDSNTVQGVLQEIRKTEEQLRIAEEEERQAQREQQRQMDWRNTVLETGATPDYQIVLMGVFFPAADHSVAA